MKEKNKNISSPKVGMTRAVSPYLLKDSAYTYMLNGQTFDESGNRLTVSSEHSNILASKFKEGYVVMGFKNFILRNKTYFFLLNPTTNVSEFGYIENSTQITELEDQLTDCTDCQKLSRKLSTPLEEIDQTPHQVYTTLLEDSCNNCLNLNINFPIRDIEIKSENVGTILVFTDGLNEPRYIELDDLNQYLFEGEDVCDQSTLTPTCLDCDKLRIFPLYKNPIIEDYTRILGGSLEKGIYEVAFAYSDNLGNELSSYIALTSEISIFDENNVIQNSDADDSATTNFGIRVELSGLDQNFTNYKIVLIQTSFGQAQVFKEVGLFSTSDNIIVISDNNGQDITRNEVLVPKISVNSWAGLTASNNYLFGYGVKENEIPNLQPIVNLLGGALKWNSTIAKEDLYSNANANQFKGYNRNEVTPFSLEFISCDGFKFPLSPLIPRPATATEIEVINNKDTQSINSVTDNCDSILRDKRWQFYNTATNEGICSVTNIPTTNQTEIIRTFTEVSVPSVPAGLITIDSNDIDDFVNLETYIEDNQTSCTVPPYTNSPLASICSFLDLDNLGGFNNVPVLEGNCTTPTLVEEVLQVVQVLNENRVDTLKDLVDYGRVRPPENCQILVIREDDLDSVDQAFSEQFAIRFFRNPAELQYFTPRRINTTYADTCQIAQDLREINPANFSSYIPQSISHPYFGAELTGDNTSPETQFANLLEPTKTALYTRTFNENEIGGLSAAQANLLGAAGVFTNNIHKGALWFKINIEDKENLLVEITRLLEPNVVRQQLDVEVRPFKNKFIRVHVFESCTSGTPIATTSYKGTAMQLGGIYELNTIPDFIPLDQSVIDQSVDGEFLYLVVDVPLSQSKGLGEGNFLDDVPQQPIIDTGITVPLNSCFSINTRDIELSQIDISFTGIDLVKTQQYTSQCTFEVPILNDCNPVPFEKGLFSYWESTEKYPDNRELFDSSGLTIENTDIPAVYRSEFENYYTNGVTGSNYNLTEETEFFCKPIRHYKFPDNIVSPFIRDSQQATNSDSIIYPLGVTINAEVVSAFLDIAVKNNLISQKRRDNITGFKLHRGDSTLDRSVKSSGLLFDLRKYTNSAGDTVHYSNFPYNALGGDKLTNTELGSLGNSNHLFTAHTPELDYFRDTPPTEISVEGFQFGKSTGVVSEVEDHPKWTILGSKARSLANALAILEVSAEAIIQAAQASSNAQIWAIAGVANGFSTGTPAFIASGVIAAFGAASAVAFNVGRFRYEWLQTFRNLGTPKNFAYYYTSVGKYNYMLPIREDENIVRGLSIRKNIKDSIFSIQDNNEGDVITINNRDREWSTLISTTSNFDLEFPTEYSNFDNNNNAPNISSQPIGSEIGCDTGVSEEFNRNIASPYVAFRDYIPNQYGSINSIRWIDTCKYIPLDSTNECEFILGGDTFITRHSVKRKTPIFNTTAFNQADLTPFNYSFYSNFGSARFFIDYEVTAEVNSGGRFFPDLDYTIATDCGTSTNQFYFEPPSKFYLYYYGQPSFLTESRINTNFRTARPEPRNQFYPQNLDYLNLTQESVVSIRERNRFFYNNNYSYQGTPFSSTQLPATYSKEVYDRQANNPNTVMYSRQDNNENSLSEPWLVYRPLDRYTFPAAYGELKRLKGIESQQVLGTFENQSVVFNAVDTYVDGVTVNNTELGTGGIFARRPRTFNDTDLGYLGSQSHALLSCEYGHFIVDAKRGQIFKITPNARGLEEISKYSGGQPNNMDVWFKEQLPFKILRDFPAFEDQIDNPLNGVGITMGWDSKFRRVFITKKDYIKTNRNDGITYDSVNNNFVQGTDTFTLQQLIQNGTLKEVSWTISFKPETGSWESYFSFKPNYYIGHTDYFQTGINQGSDASEFGLWSHLLTNKSKQVFYGKKYPFDIEYPITNKYVSKKLESINLWTEAKRYHNSYDFAIDDRVTFNKAVIYNDRESSGNLELVVNNGTLSQLSKYPITKANSQEILISQDDKEFNFNYFFNRTISNRNNLPLFIWDENQIEKTVNQNAVSFKGKRVLERLTGEVFLVRLRQDLTSQYDIELKWAMNLEQNEI